MKKVLQHPLALYLLTNVMVFLLLYLYRTPHDNYILYAGAAVIAMTTVVHLIFRHFNLGDRYLFIIAAMLVTLGVAMICRLNYGTGTQQIIWYGVGLLAYIISFLVFRYWNFWKNLQWTYFWIGIVLLVLTEVVGRNINGARNWIYIGSFSIQPSEVVKILFALFLASFFFKHNERELFGIKEKWFVMASVYIYCGFLMLQGEWGSMVLFFATYIIMLFIAHGTWKELILNLGLIGVVGWLAATHVSHIETRISNWLRPFGDIAGKSYQAAQSLFAISSGGFFGSGLGLGQPGLIPEATSDFIFSAVCEEMGLLGGCAVILLFFIFVYRGFKIAINARGFEKWLATILTVIFGLQCFIIIGGVINLIPLTGITLPFISYGGSSLVMTFSALGILQAISAKT